MARPSFAQAASITAASLQRQKRTSLQGGAQLESSKASTMGTAAAAGGVDSTIGLYGMTARSALAFLSCSSLASCFWLFRYCLGGGPGNM